MGAGTMTQNMRLGLVILAAVLIRAGCAGEPAGDFSSTAGQLDSAPQELGGQDLLNGSVFADGYSCCRLGNTVLYCAKLWYGPHQVGSVILAENQETGEFSLVDLGCWQRLSIREIQETADPAVVRIFFTDGIVFDGSEYYTRILADSVDYSRTAGEVTAENSLCVPGRYGMVGDSVEYRHRFGDCEVTDGRIALRFAVTGTTGWEGYPRSTEVVLPEIFQPGEPGEKNREGFRGAAGENGGQGQREAGPGSGSASGGKTPGKRGQISAAAVPLAGHPAGLFGAGGPGVPIGAD